MADVLRQIWVGMDFGSNAWLAVSIYENGKRQCEVHLKFNDDLRIEESNGYFKVQIKHDGINQIRFE